MMCAIRSSPLSVHRCIAYVTFDVPSKKSKEDKLTIVQSNKWDHYARSIVVQMSQLSATECHYWKGLLFRHQILWSRDCSIC
ncbi:hypothetical protein CEXT_245671 [Caerostris extrusa]|uniref:Uncharacterized protein n=1 Tax=Caerostris extrusa TaxID=172846 RepID=A0AAV4N5D8_CAEEX|nr:hypothetical protein CEXT_245671 [Caerostris extrusa]